MVQIFLHYSILGPHRSKGVHIVASKYCTSTSRGVPLFLFLLWKQHYIRPMLITKLTAISYRYQSVAHVFSKLRVKSKHSVYRSEDSPPLFWIFYSEFLERKLYGSSCFHWQSNFLSSNGMEWTASYIWDTWGIEIETSFILHSESHWKRSFKPQKGSLVDEPTRNGSPTFIDAKTLLIFHVELESGRHTGDGRPSQ